MKLGRLLLLWTIVLAASASLAMAAKTPRQNMLPPDLKTLQGSWNLLETDVNGQSVRPRVLTQWVFVGNRLYLRAGGKTVPQGFVELSSSQKPRTITLTVQGRPTVLGIYEVRGQKLAVCASANQRPTVFVAEASNVVSVLERATTAHAQPRARTTRR